MNKLKQLEWEKNLLEDGFTFALDEKGKDITEEVILELEFEIEDELEKLKDERQYHT